VKHQTLAGNRRIRRRRRYERSVRIVAMALAMMAMTTTASFALNWNSSTTPLTVTGYGSTGKAYGSWTISTGTDGTRFRTSANQWINNADNRAVYVVTENWTTAGSCLQPDYTSCKQDYYYYNSSKTGQTTQKSWVNKKSSASVDPRASYGRAYVRVKLSVPWRTDPSSGATVTKGIKY
jgi:hypothetical protein